MMMILQAGNQSFTLRKAEEKDLDKVLGILVSAAEWLQTKGTSQWDYYIKDLEGNTGEVLDSIQNKSTYILEKENIAVATLTLEDKPGEWDQDIWGEEAKQEGYVYLHRLAVSREYSGLGIGDALMDWAKREVKQQGKCCIRFDCLNSNEGLNKYYQRNFELKGIANIFGRHSKFEIKV